MTTLPELVGFRERLYSGRFSGVRSVRDSNGEEVTYRSDAELAAAIASLETLIRQRETELGCSRIIYPRTSKGL